MSEVAPGRRRRADAERNVAAILDAAGRVLGSRPGASVEDVAMAAGVSRQTVYAHFPTRDALLMAVWERATAQAVAAIDALDLDDGPAADALLRLLDVVWSMFERAPHLLATGTAVPMSADESHDLHQPVLDRLDRLVRRGQEAGEFDAGLPRPWLLATLVALGHAAGEEVGAGRMPAGEAFAALRTSVLRVFRPGPAV